MAVTFVSAGAQSSSASATTLSPALPASTVNGDLLLAVVSGSSVEGFTPPAGWTPMYQQLTANTPWVTYYRFVDGTETTPTFTTASVAGACAAVITAYRGVDKINPFVAAAEPVSGSAGSSATTRTVRSGKASQFLVGIFCSQSNGASTAGAGVNATSVTQRVNTSGGVNSAGGIYGSIGIVTGDLTAALTDTSVTINNTGAMAYGSIVLNATPNSCIQSKADLTGAKSNGSFSINGSINTGGLVVGNLLVLCAWRAVASGAVSIPAGFTTFASWTVNGANHVIAYKFMATPAEAHPSGNTFTGCTWDNAYAMTVGSVNKSFPINVSAQTDVTVSSSSQTFPAVTPTTANTLLLLAYLFGGASLTAVTGATIFVTNRAAYATGPAANVSSGTFAATLGASNTDTLFNIAVNPTTITPFAPTLLDPANNAYVDLAAGYTFSWVHNPAGNPGDVQTNYALRRKVGAGSYEYWNAGSLAWQGTIVWNASATQGVTFGSGKWTTGTTYNYSVATQSAGGQGPFASDFTVSASVAPTVTVTGPGAVVTQASPSVTFTETLSSGAVQTGYRVVIEGGPYGATPGSGVPYWDSGVVPSAILSVPVGTGLPNGTAYRAFVQVTETGGQVSTWGTRDFTTAYDPPARPVLVAVWDSTRARAALAVQGRDSLLTANQGSIETDTSGWSAYSNCTIARSTAQVMNGVASLALTSVASGDMWAGPPGSGAGTGSPVVVGGAAYLVVASFRAAVSARQVYVQVDWYNAGVYVSSSVGQKFADNASGWSQAALVAVAPATATNAEVLVRVVATGAAAEVHYIDQVGIMPLGTVDDNGYGVNLLDGTDFESGTDGWTTGGGLPALTQDSTKAYTGRSSVRADATGSAQLAYANVTTVVGQTYTVSMKVLVTGASTWTAIMRDNVGGVIGGSDPASPSAVWQTMTYTGVATTTTTRFGFRAGGTGTAYIDAVKVEVGSTATPFVPRTYSNLTVNSSFEVDLSQWAAIGGSPPVATRDTSRSYVGSACAKIAWLTGSSGGNAAFKTSSHFVVTGQTYTLSGYVFVPTGSTPVGLVAYSAGILTASPRSSETTVFDTWQRLSVTFTAIGTGFITTQVDINVAASGTAVAGSVAYLDAVQFVLGNDPLPYIDGSLPGGSWDSANNLLSAQNSSFEAAGVGGWTAGTNWTIANSTAQAQNGTHSLLATRSNTTVGNGYALLGSIPCAPNTTYTVSLWMHASAATGYLLSLRGNISSGPNFTFLATANTWIRVTQTLTTGPTDSTLSLFLADDNNAAPTSGSTVYIDAVQVEQRAYATPYGAAGAANAATSTRQPAWGPGGFSAIGDYVIEASEDGGATWATVRGASALPVDSAAHQQITAYDYERTPNATVLYRARVVDDQVVSLNSVQQSLVAAMTSWWVKDLYTPGLNMQLCDAQQNVRNRKGDSVPVQPAGRTNPIVLRGPVHGADGSFRTVVDTEAERTSALALYSAQDPILIQDPRGRQWYSEWVGDLNETPLRVDQPYYALQRSWVEVDVPS